MGTQNWEQKTNKDFSAPTFCCPGCCGIEMFNMVSILQELLKEN